MSTLTVKELSAPTGEVIKIAAGKTLDLKSQGTVKMPAGSVVQVVNATTATKVTSTSNSTWVDTTVIASITPLYSDSKILITINQHVGNFTSGLGGDYNILRGSTSIKHYTNYSRVDEVTGGQIATVCTFTVLDSPSTTSQVTYKTQGKHRGTNSGTIVFQDNTSGTAGALAESQITLMEIAQ